MNVELARIDTVSPRGEKALTIVRRDGSREVVDLSEWIATGGATLKPLHRAELFRAAIVVDFGATVQWGDGDDLTIESYHLSLIASKQ